MKLYLIGGLGADERVFEVLNLNCETKVISWIEPSKDEPIDVYVKRLLAQINTTKPFGIMGVSFGGLIAIELSKISNPEILILISSVESSDQLKTKFLTLGKLGLLNLVPTAFIKPPKFLQSYLFGAKNSKLLNEIIKDTDPRFIRWALKKMIAWKSAKIDVKTLRIHGTKDKLIPLIGEAKEIQNGAHFMIVDLSLIHI